MNDSAGPRGKQVHCPPRGVMRNTADDVIMQFQGLAQACDSPCRNIHFEYNGLGPLLLEQQGRRRM